MLHERLLNLSVRVPSPYLAAQEPDEALLELARRQFPEGHVHGMQLIVRMLEITHRGAIELFAEAGTPEGRADLVVRTEVFTINRGETLHGCIVDMPLHDYDIAHKNREIQVDAQTRIPIHVQIVLVEHGPKPLKKGDNISVVVDETTYTRQTGMIGVFGRALSPTTLPQNEFFVGSGSLTSEEVKRLQAETRLALDQIKELEKVHPGLAKRREKLYGAPQGSQPLLTLLAAPPNMKRVRMPHPWTGRVDVAPLSTLSQTEPAGAVMEGLVELLRRAVREMRDLASS